MRHELLQIEELSGPDERHRVLRLRGPLLMSNLFHFQETVRANRGRLLILDLTQVPYVDSAGIGALVGAYVTYDEGRRLALVGVSERVRNTMQVAHVDRFFRFYETAQAAQDELEPSAPLSKTPPESAARRSPQDASLQIL